MKTGTFNESAGYMDSGHACLWIICRYFNKGFDAADIHRSNSNSQVPSSLRSIGREAEKIGLRARCVKLTYRQLTRIGSSPCMLEWGQGFVVLMPATGWIPRRRLKIDDPSRGMIYCSKKEFLQQWTGQSTGSPGQKGAVLLLEPSFGFREGARKDAGLNWRVVLDFFRRSRWQLAWVAMAFLISSLVQLIFPFLMQGIVDVGINTRNMQYVTVLLIAQLVLVFSRVIADLIRGRLLLHISTSVNLSILSEFWIKIMRLPLTYFDRRHTGEVLQRINDNRQIQNFVTGPALNTFFSMLNFIVFSVVLLIYKAELFAVFVAGITLYFFWIRVFLKYRRRINNQTFEATSMENNVTLQLVEGMQEIRLQNMEQPKRWEWESMQAKIFRLNFRNLTYMQWQQAGAIFINQGKDALLTFIVAGAVIKGQLTFGAMLAIQYIIGQLSAPVEQFIGFLQAAQDAKISMERLNEVHRLENEEERDKEYIRHLPARRSITLSHLLFRYPGDNPNPALSDIDLEIPQGRITALVGESGCGKTTLLKVLLKYYDQYEGDITVGDIGFRDFSASFWRNKCGAVLQDGYIFQDTIRANIVMGGDKVDEDRLIEACFTANILSFIQSLPDGFDTILETNGLGISQGQKQRLLIARVVYKDPEYIFLDESTNSLDEINESAVVKNLESFFRNKTVILVAHRLHTVMHAHNIVVMHQGRIVEQGTHEELTERKGKYFWLAKTQLELSVD